MNDSEQPDYATLGWVKEGIDESLHIARKSLEGYIAADYSGEGIQQYVTQLHQVLGTLRMVQIYGAGMLVEEMEHIGLALVNGELDPDEGLVETLMLGLAQLPSYLQRVENGAPDIPVVLLPVLNDLRSARNASPASEVSIYAPNLDQLIDREPVIPNSGNADIGELIHNQRNRYHKGLLEWYRDENSDHGLHEVLDIVRRVNAAAGTLRLRSLMDAAEALTLILIGGEFSASDDVKRLYSRLDRIFKRLMDMGEENTVKDFPRELYKNLLYFVARSSSNDPVVNSVRNSADLANSFTSNVKAETEGADQDALDAVKDVVLADLNVVKETFDLFIRGEHEETGRLAGLADRLDQLGDTLGMIGRGALRQQLQSCSASIRNFENQPSAITEESLMQLATDLLSVETALTNQQHSLPDADDAPVIVGSADEHVRNQDAVIQQAFIEVSSIKSQLETHLEHPELEINLEQMLEDLAKLAAVFNVVGMTPVSELLTGITPQLQRLSAADLADLPPARREAIVDFFTGVDYYLETRLMHGSSLDNILDYSWQALRLFNDENASAEEATTFFVPPEKPIASDSELISDSGTVSAADSEPAMDMDAELDIQLPVAPEVVRAYEAPVVATSQTVQLDEIDPEIFDIFMEEARDVLAAIQEHYPQWRNHQDDEEALQVVRRSFHTLKGSGRMVGANTIGEFAWAIENLLNRLLEGGVQADADFLAVMEETVAVLPALIQGQAEGQMPDFNLAALEERAFALAEGRPIAEQQPAEDLDREVPVPDSELDSPPAILMEDDLYQIFSIESTTHLATIKSYLDDTAGKGSEVTDDLARAVHTLRGSSHLAEVDAMASLADEMEGYCNHLRQLNQPIEGEGLSALRVFHQYMKSMLDAVNVAGSELPDWQNLTTDVAGLNAALPEVISQLQEAATEAEASVLQQVIDPEMLGVFLEEAAELTEQLEQSFVEWTEDPSQNQAVDSLKRGLHTLKGSARMAGVDSLGDLIHALESMVEKVLVPSEEITADVSDMIRHALDQIENTLDMLHLRSPLPDQTILTHQLQTMSETLAAQAESESLLQEDSRYVADEEPEAESILLPEKWDVEAEAAELSALSEAETGAGETEPPRLDVDPELLEIFLEEAGELSEKLEQGFSDWTQNVSGKDAIDALMRSLHTLKGNARFAQMSDLGDLSHGLESLFENLASEQLQAENELIPLVRVAMDKLELSIDQLQNQQPIPILGNVIEAVNAAAVGQAWELPVETGMPDSELISVDDSSRRQPDTTTATTDMPDSSFIVDSQLLTDSELMGDSKFVTADSDLPKGKVLPFRADEAIDITRPHKRPPPMQAEETRVGQGERVRVRSELLNQLVNNAGEVSIYRARLEQQNISVGYNLEELTQTVGRLQTQLRALERETETQVLSRHERDRETAQYSDFDPLEMDRYSTMQQLSRALSETIGDLSDIGETLQGLARDTDTLLLQQARTTNDLQDGLLRTRMVPFNRQASRLQRVVRQTSQGLGKKADLFVQGEKGEIDRSILNRMMGPLEHLLRNAVAHGIETPAERLELGKSEEGKVTLMLAREGTEIVITLSDDGRGLDPERLREIAVEKGLLNAEAEVSDEALYQFILTPGFTTAREITQVAGRGVGMDAVLSELKQLGGNLEIESQKGRGSSFIIRLPFTLAISDALLVKAADEVFAIPHGNTELIVRATRQDLMACYRGKSSGIAYGGHEYPVRYLGAMLGIAEAVLPSTSKWYPVLLVRSGEERVAIQLDQLLGNYQVVVKSIGGQLSGVRWFTGGTILADGDIALLLDLNVLVRSDIAQRAQITEPVGEESSGVTIMVVDDSITVRKVTSRLLERHNMKVVTAKDGVDAVTVLQDTIPDVMLLDIEMPRMDGYELARHIRNTPELEHIPIIMITSRTGEKHRERAMQLGVDQYLGKPFQEAELLDNIYTLLADHTNE